MSKVWIIMHFNEGVAGVSGEGEWVVDYVTSVDSSSRKREEGIFEAIQEVRKA